MTRQCREVLSQCDFPESAAHYVERYLCRATPAQVVALVWAKDPDGGRPADWFAPFFDRGYVRSKVSVSCSFDGAFWEAYDWLSQACDGDLSTFDLPAVDEMARDLPRMRRAFGSCRVKTVPYLLKVFQGQAPSPARADNSAEVASFEVASRGAKPRGEP